MKVVVGLIVVWDFGMFINSLAGRSWNLRKNEDNQANSITKNMLYTKENTELLRRFVVIWSPVTTFMNTQW